MKIAIPKTIQDRPALLGDMASAVTELRRTGLVTVDDSLLEHLIAPWLESREGVTTAAVYGFNCGLRIVALVNVMGAETEILVELRPAPPIWQKGVHLLEFNYTVLSVEHTNKGVKIAKDVASEILGLIGPCVGLVASCLFNKVSMLFGRARIKDVIDLGVEGITLHDDQITVDLDTIPEPRNLLWYKPKLSGTHSLIAKVAAKKFGLEDSSLGDLFDLSSMSMGREGVTLKLDISTEGQKAMDTAGELLSGTRSMSTKLWGSASKLLDKKKGEDKQALSEADSPEEDS